MADDPFLPLRIPGSPVEAPEGYLPLEDALNALGRQDYENEWGRLPGWSQMPFRWRSKSRRYVRHQLRLFGQRARLQRVTVTSELTKAEKQACIQLYKQVRRTIREALESGKLHAHAVQYATGDLTPIIAGGIWRKQAGPIFFTGRTVLREPDKPDRLADVVLTRKRFEQWLAARAREKANWASKTMLEKVSAAIAEHRQQHEYEIIRADVQKLVTEIARQNRNKVSDRRFKKLVWKPLGATAGRRAKEQQARYKKYEADLKICINTAFGGASGT